MLACCEAFFFPACLFAAAASCFSIAMQFADGGSGSAHACLGCNGRWLRVCASATHRWTRRARVSPAMYSCTQNRMILIAPAMHRIQQMNSFAVGGWRMASARRAPERDGPKAMHFGSQFTITCPTRTDDEGGQLRRNGNKLAEEHERPTMKHTNSTRKREQNENEPCYDKET